MPSIAVGAAFFILFSNEHINLFNTYTLLIIAGTIKVHPFASRSALNSMLQISNEIEGGGDHPGYPMDETNVPDHHPDPEVSDHQRIHAPRS